MRRSSIELIKEYIEITRLMEQLDELDQDERWRAQYSFRYDIEIQLHRRNIQLPIVKKMAV